MAVKPPPAPDVKLLGCRGCGAPLAIRAPGHSLTVACGACGAVLDARDPDFQVIARHDTRTRVTPRIPLGARGRLKGEPFETIGVLVRESEIEGETYTWTEYLLLNPHRGFRWLSEYDGHWALSKAASGTPAPRANGAVTHLGMTFKHFQTASAKVRWVLGEFPWVARVGDTAVVSDYIAPPHLLTSERTDAETNWSIGESIEGEALWKAFGLPGQPPARVGVGAAQPNPLAPHGGAVRRMLLRFLAAAMLIHLVFLVFSQRRVVLERAFVAEPGRERTVVIEPFELTGRRSNVVIDLRAGAYNTWAYFTLALINEETGRALTFGREVGFYAGRDSDGAWSEGSQRDRVYLPSIPSGRYSLTIDVETNAGGFDWTVTVRRDVPRWLYLWWATGLLLVPPLIFWYRRARFEYTRWQAGGHPWLSSVTTGKTSGDDD